MARFTYRPQVETELASSGYLMPIARRIAEETRRNAMAAQGEYGDLARRYARDVTAVETAQGARVLTDGDSFGHLVEWGTATNPPAAPMRRAAQRFGRFRGRQ
jgi:hypothetical protein